MPTSPVTSSGRSPPPAAGTSSSCSGPSALFLIGALTFLMLIKDGLGHAGYQPPVFWSVYITTFVFWVGIGHAGTLISAILFLFRSPWRTAVYRSTEAMTVFAVMTAGLFPIIHIGRQWIFYWLLPYPNSRYLWPNFKSPLVWDVFAISTYLTVSTTFLVFGLIPDVAAVRDKASGWRKKIYEALVARLAGHRQPVAALLPGLPLPRRAGDAAGALGALGGVLGLRHVASSPAGTARSSRRTSWPAPSTPASAWCSR